MGLDSIGTPIFWGIFIVVVLGMLALDLGVFHSRSHELGVGEAMLWVCVWIVLALSFNVAVYLQFGPERAFEFSTGYLIEKALSVDNLLVFAAIFSLFAVPPAIQHRALSGGSLGRWSCVLSSSCLVRRCSRSSIGFVTCWGPS